MLFRMFAPNRMKKLGALMLVCFSIGTTGCTLIGNNITLPDRKTRLGEWTSVWGGVLAVLYRKPGSGYLGTSQLILNQYKFYRRFWNIETSSILTMEWTAQFCGPGLPGDYCRAALQDEQWSDFRNDSLVPVDHTTSACIAVQFGGGINWTYRNRTDKHCTP